MTVNGRQKGTRGEREVAGIMRDWWSAHDAHATFVRTPMSGGWQTNTKAAAHFKACGDLMTTSPSFPFCVEVKWREKWSIDRLLDGRPTEVWGWWRQAIEAANKQGSVPMLWARRNRIPGTRKPFPWIVMLPMEFIDVRVLDAPDITWDPDTLLLKGVDATVMPGGYVFTRFMKMDPRRMLDKPLSRIRLSGPKGVKT